MTAHSNRLILITGAGRGIGRELLAQALLGGAEVVACVRSAAAEAELRSSLPTMQSRLRIHRFDLCSLVEVAQAARSIRSELGPVPRIVHNAGTLHPPHTLSLTPDGIEETLQIHAVAPALLTRVLQTGCDGPTRAVFVTSRLHRAARRDDLPFAQHPSRYRAGRAYRTAKLVQLAYAQEWERHYGAVGHHADAICPGFVAITASATAPTVTRPLLALVSHSPVATDPARAARSIRDLVERPLNEPGGSYVEVGASGAPSFPAPHDQARGLAVGREPDRAPRSRLNRAQPRCERKPIRRHQFRAEPGCVGDSGRSHEAELAGGHGPPPTTIRAMRTA